MQAVLNPSDIPQMQSNPTPSKDSLLAERKLFCIHYDSCLDLAVERHWKGFSCENCRGFRPVEWDAEDRTEDEFHCMALLLVVFFESHRGHLSPDSIVKSLECAARCHQGFDAMAVG